MKAAKFNTLDYANELVEAGFTQKQANAQAKALFAVVQDQTLNKQDLKNLEIEMKHGFERLDLKIQDSASSLLIRLITTMTVIMSALGALFKFVPFVH